MSEERRPYQTPNATVPSHDAAERSLLLKVLSVFGTGFAYAIAIWIVFAFVYRPFFAGRSGTENSAQSAKEQLQQQEQMRLYDEQTRKTGELLSESERQQKRMDAVLTKQEDHAKRMEAVIGAWERQIGAKK